MNGKHYFIKTFGCQMNERDSEIMAQSLAGFGYYPAAAMTAADLVIINTCSVRAKAEQKVMSLLGHLRKLKKERPEVRICVAGCVAQQEGRRIIERMPHVDLVLGTQQIYRLPELLAGAAAGGARTVTDLADSYRIPRYLPRQTTPPEETFDLPESGSSFRKFVTIMQGCNNFCTYCVVPYTRGREVSRQAREILDEVEVLVAGGVKEITLLGQNVNSYGRTNPVAATAGYGFAELLREVAAIPGLARLRFTTSNPKDLDEALIRCFAEIELLCPQFHLPVQAGSDRVLARMNRRYTVASYLEKVDRLNEYCPGIALTTDIIVGFPGETEEDFAATMALLERVRFHGSFSFKYSDRPGTRASKMAEKVAEEVKTARLARFQARQDEISLARNQEYLGEEVAVLLEEVAAEEARGRSATNHLVHFSEALPHRPGEIVPAIICHAGQHSLKGRLAV
jgi:tRNA-2-methylthio-N6-dimethylallyladenosine synthase